MDVGEFEKELTQAYTGRPQPAHVLNEVLRLRIEQLAGRQQRKVLEFLATDNRAILDTLSTQGLRLLCSITGAKASTNMKAMAESIYDTHLLNPRGGQRIEEDDDDDDDTDEDNGTESRLTTTPLRVGRGTPDLRTDGSGGSSRVTTYSGMGKQKPRAPKLNDHVLESVLRATLLESDGRRRRDESLLDDENMQGDGYVANYMKRVSKLSGLQQRLVVDFITSNDSELLSRMSIHGLRVACGIVKVKQHADAQVMIDTLKRRRTGVNLFSNVGLIDQGRAHTTTPSPPSSARVGGTSGRKRRACEVGINTVTPSAAAAGRQDIRVDGTSSGSSSVSGSRRGRVARRNAGGAASSSGSRRVAADIEAARDQPSPRVLDARYQRPATDTTASASGTRSAASRGCEVRSATQGRQSGGSSSSSSDRRCRACGSCDVDESGDVDEHITSPGSSRSLLVASKMCDAAEALIEQVRSLQSSAHGAHAALAEDLVLRARRCVQADPTDSHEVRALVVHSRIKVICMLADTFRARSEEARRDGRLDVAEGLLNQRLDVLRETVADES
jgi:hypothetical protein